MSIFKQQEYIVEDSINLQPLDYYEEELDRAVEFTSKKQEKFRKHGCLTYEDHLVQCHHMSYVALLRDRIRYIKAKGLA